MRVATEMGRLDQKALICAGSYTRGKQSEGSSLASTSTNCIDTPERKRVRYSSAHSSMDTFICEITVVHVRSSQSSHHGRHHLVLFDIFAYFSELRRHLVHSPLKTTWFSAANNERHIVLLLSFVLPRQRDVSSIAAFRDGAAQTNTLRC